MILSLTLSFPAELRRLSRNATAAIGSHAVPSKKQHFDSSASALPSKYLFGPVPNAKPNGACHPEYAGDDEVKSGATSCESVASLSSSECLPLSSAGSTHSADAGYSTLKLSSSLTALTAPSPPPPPLPPRQKTVSTNHISRLKAPGKGLPISICLYSLNRVF